MIGSVPYLRPVILNDAQLLYDWRNEARRSYFHSEVISFENHCEWLKKYIDSLENYLYILMDKNVPIGQVRIDIFYLTGFISYSIDNKYRSMGYGKIILMLLENEAYGIYGEDFSLVGNVKKNNIASQRIFDQLGYLKEYKEQHIQYIKHKIKPQIFLVN